MPGHQMETSHFMLECADDLGYYFNGTALFIQCHLLTCNGILRAFEVLQHSACCFVHIWHATANFHNPFWLLIVPVQLYLHKVNMAWPSQLEQISNYRIEKSQGVPPRYSEYLGIKSYCDLCWGIFNIDEKSQLMLSTIVCNDRLRCHNSDNSTTTITPRHIAFVKKSHTREEGMPQ